ncbi:MAG: phage baseplate assembly protein V [Candidatus Zixiibacteriota bacterium]
MAIDESEYLKPRDDSSSSSDDSPESIAIPVETEIKISGQTISQEMKNDVAGFELSQPIDGHHELRLNIYSHGEVARGQDFSGNATNYSKMLGESLSLSVKSADYGNLAFVGDIAELEIDNGVGGLEYVTIIAKSPTIKMDGAKCNVFFKDMKASDIISSIVRSTQITPGTVDATSSTMKFCVQYRETDYDFITRLATGAGMFAFYDGEKFHVTKKGGTSSVTAKFRESIGSFKFKWGTSPFGVQTGTSNYEDKKTLGSSKKTTSISMSNLTDFSKKASEKLYPKESFQEVTGTVKDAKSIDDTIAVTQGRVFGRMIVCTGTSIVPSLKVGHKLRIEAFGDFNGEYLILKIVHKQTNHGLYYNTFTCAPVEVAHSQLQAKRRSAAEIQSAIVVDNNDPDQLGRIKVKFPWLDSDDTVWLRIANPYAGNERGWYSLPEIDDEVLVAYEHGSPDRPIIIGSLYNGKDKPSGDVVDQDNLIKGFITKSGNKIILNDKDGEEEISITAKDGTQVVLNSKDPSITVKTTGDITLDGNNITIKAQGKVAVEGNGIELTSSGDFKAEGSMNMGIKGGIETKVEGTMVTVKGNPIQLN